ncbi:protein CFAP20DC [Microcaecilia unicolor]|uniref:Uncharacterized protein C3orf67 homolog n=1 Tax=Microcaecilia unicolor TaxID=1415580 RepID=A0A6P7YBL0_9AMPH|nr:uncharacterized protein C3orf67 homolog [Microcaecilia unicolor]
MFKNEYQGGPFVEVFSAQGKDPAAKWKFIGSPSAIWKDFDKEVKSFVFILEGSIQTNRMQLPKENKQTLGLIQQFLILQVNVPLGKDFSIELLITDLGNIKRRLYLSTVHKELSSTPLHAKIPLFIIRRKIWCNLCIDLVAFTSGIFRGAVFQSLDGIIVSANCKLRKIFTMKLKPQGTPEEDDIYGKPLTTHEPTDVIPRSCQFTTGVLQVTQLFNMTNLYPAEIKLGVRPLTSAVPDQLTTRGSGSIRSSKNQDVSHIAFGSKVLGPPPSTGRRLSLRISADAVKLMSDRNDKSSRQPNLCIADESEQHSGRFDLLSSQFRDASDQRNKENIHQIRQKAELPASVDQQIIQPCPHLPREPSADKNNNKRRLHVRNTDKNTTEIVGGSSPSGHCRNEDKSSVKLRTPSCEKLNNLELSNNSCLQQLTAPQTDEWIFPNSFQKESSKQSVGSHDLPCTNYAPYGRADKINETNKLQKTHEDVFMYSSRPRSVPHGKSQNSSVDGYTVPLEFEEDSKAERRGARMEDDFYGSDSSEEDSLSVFIRCTPSPKTAYSKLESSSPTTVAEDSVERTPMSYECNSSGGSDKDSQKEIMSSNPQISYVKKVDADNIQKKMMPTPSLSPTGSWPEFSKEIPNTSKTLKDMPVSQIRTSMNKRSVKEIPKEDSRLTADPSGYNWRNYQCNKMSASELQMLASLRRQQCEELEDSGTSHCLSASQIDHCNVNISTSSDDTTTWNSCLPLPVSQGHHYQNEMHPLSRSNPRDWLNVFSPPIIPPSQQLAEQVDFSEKQKQSTNQNTCMQDENITTEDEEEILTLLYDPCLNCYFDPETGKYYELA